MISKLIVLTYALALIAIAILLPIGHEASVAAGLYSFGIGFKTLLLS